MFELTEILDEQPRRGSLFGNRVRAARRRLEMSQESLADAVGVSRTAITQIELGKALPSLPTLTKICIALKVTPNDLIWCSAPDSATEKPTWAGE